MPIDGHTSSIRSEKESNLSPDTRKDINRSSQTPVREKPQVYCISLPSINIVSLQDFSIRADPLS